MIVCIGGRKRMDFTMLKKFKRGDYVVISTNIERRGIVWFKRGKHVFVELHKPIKVGRGITKENITILCAHEENVFHAASWDRKFV